MRGQMLWFNETKDHGFIMTEEGERLAVAGEGFAGGERPVGRCAHKAVSFDVEERDGARQAQNVIFEPEIAARRARRRGSRFGR